MMGFLCQLSIGTFHGVGVDGMSSHGTVVAPGGVRGMAADLERPFYSMSFKCLSTTRNSSSPHSSIALLRSLIPTLMNAEACTWEYFGLSMENQFNSNTTFFPLQGPPALDEGRTHTRPQDIPVCSHYPQVDAEARNARFLVGCSAPPSYHLTRISGMPLSSLSIITLYYLAYRRSICQ